MTFDRRQKRTSRETKLDIEALGDRIAPAVFHHGLVSMNLVVENHNPNNELKVKKHHHEKSKASEKVEHQKHAKSEKTKMSNLLPMDKPTIVPPSQVVDNVPVPATNPVFLPMDRPTVVTTGQTSNSGPANGSNPVYLPMDKPTIATTGQTSNSGPANGSNPVYLPMDKPTIDTSTTDQTNTGGPVVTTYKVSLPMDRPLTPSSTPTSLPNNVDQALATIYGEYAKEPSGFTGNTSTANGANLVLVQGDAYGIQIHDSNPDEFQSLVNELTNAGMNITTSSATYGTVVGTLPISELLTVAQFSNNISINSDMVHTTK